MEVVHADRLRRVCRSPERLESRPGPDEPCLGRLTLLQPSADSKLEQESSNIEYLRRNHQDGYPSKAGEDVSPLAVAELGVDSMEEVHVGHEWFVPAQIVIANVDFREDLGKALQGRLPVVGDDQPASRAKLVQPPLEGCSAHTVGGNHSSILSLEPRVYRVRPARDVSSTLGRSDELLSLG